MKRTMVREDGTLGEVEWMGFVTADAIKRYLSKTREGILFTVGLSYRNPTTHNKPLDYEQAVEMLDKYRYWFLEAVHDGSKLSVTALSDNDLW